MCLQIFLIISAFDQPDIGYGQSHSGIGVGPDWYPLIGMNSAAVIYFRADVYLLDTKFGEPVA